MSRTETVTMYAVGDVGVNRDEPDLGFTHVASFLGTGVLRFCQLERTYSERGTPASASIGRSRGHPRNASALKIAGFDVVSVASNHCMDWGAEAFLDTIRLLKDMAISVVGGGKNIDEARRPAVIEHKGNRIAFLAYNSILPPGYWADEVRPGCAPIRVRTFYVT